MGRQESNDADSFKTLLASSSFMTPIESRNEQSLNRVRMFNRDKLNAEIVNQKWDRVKVVCTQPFNKHLKYGLSFLQIMGGEEGEEEKKKEPEKEKAASDSLTLGRFKLLGEDKTKSEDLSAGAFFAKRKEEQPKKLSTAAEMKSEKTLASLALEEAGTVVGGGKKRKNSGENGEQSAEKKPKFYQLKKESYEKVMTPQPKRDDKKKLPRRDVLPGESPPRKKDPPKTDEKKATPKTTPKPKSTKPFRKLLEGVVFTISGIQNPTRGQIREKALSMGAKYKPDWDKSCTHLICAFANTPKFNQVKGKGKIVKKDWVEKCHGDKKRYPWRRFCLDPKDSKKDESEDEIWDESLLPGGSTSSSSSSRQSGAAKRVDEEEMDTDEEIEAIRKQEEEDKKAAEDRKKKEGGGGEKEKKKSPVKNKKQISHYDDETDDDDMGEDDEKKKKADTTNGKASEIAAAAAASTEGIEGEEDSDDAYNADTDVDEENQPSESKKSLNGTEKGSSSSWPDLPDFFSKTTFYIFGDFPASDRKILARKIAAANGKLSAYMNPEVRFVISGSKWNRDFDEALEQNRRIKFVKASFVHASWKEKKLLPWSDYGISRR